MIALLGVSCSSSRVLSRSGESHVDELLRAPHFNYHLGLHIEALGTGEVIKSINADQYFTPASNTKILSLALGLEVLGDSMPFGRLIQYGDTTFVQPFGDPTFLHPDFEDQRIYDRLSSIQTDHLKVDLSVFEDERLGTGWSWDDYNGAYQIERGALPIYGHFLAFKDGKGMLAFFDDRIKIKSTRGRYQVQRSQYSNDFNVYGHHNAKGAIKAIPIKINDELTASLLSDTLNISVHLGGFASPPMARINSTMLNSRPVDSLLIPMMVNSDNFFAEQIIMMSSQMQLGKMDESEIISWAKDQWNTPDELLWYDGSGLSRYNQLTPRSLIHILQRLHSKYGLDQVLKYMPAGGVRGTINSWFGGTDGTPYIYAKTGTLRNVYCLSGFMRGDSGKWYVFSWMNNNFPGSSSSIKPQMEQVLLDLKSQL